MKRIGLILAGITATILIICVAAVVLFFLLLKPISSVSASSESFIIKRGESVSSIGNRLAEQGLVHHPLIFRFVVIRDGLQNKIQAGSFTLSPDMSVAEIAYELTQGTEDIWITIPEGMRVEEIADLLERQELEDFDKAAFITLASQSEGYLYPDTYLVPKLATAQTIYSLLTNTFESKVIVGLAEEIAASEYSLEEAVIMASLIEREAANTEEMPDIAGVLWNRIQIGMALQVDATLQYIKGYDPVQDAWWVPPLAADKALVSPYNTYQNPGLPPRPISSPGVDAIKAALAPGENNYLFYIHDRQGGVHYATTLEQHNQNISRYLR